ncbi:hypothetical protein PHYSODRAFT_307718 [Phytophthora sojae]|uniref:Uncharacterized protein n=1 Tax=Phytophthora sojae (strain P6497) TaxID=1094619 RepID=G5AFR5_PHYSP|nr:hypothetical protein PHYSODRAFT_307718 [Phytophthora sojae]EGZ05431.1 hypothetical protein PHYSODRAFT_307718 [Phytophthora sojae]|eukprot:XP_009538962.1 hypothetical protein PHYSODRAFT_307718 [Phytophthora sojae]
MILGGAISTAGLVDTFIRQVARTVLRLPFLTPRQVFYDQQNGVGLESCELDANVHRMQEALRILNSPELPVYHLLVERLEAYQTHAGLPDNPFVLPVKPPAQVRTWEAQLIRFAASLKPPLRFAVKWAQPPAVRSLRANDRPLIEITPPQLRGVLVAVNWNSDCKLIFVGDLCGVYGTSLLTRAELQRKGKWVGAKKARVDQLYEDWKCHLVHEGTLDLRVPVGCQRLPPGVASYQMRIGVGEWIIAVQLDTQDAVPRVDHYELGYREIGDVARHQLGTVIPIHWWYERPRGSDIWYERTHRAVVNEFEAVCVPVIVRYLPRRRNRKDRIILWTTTQVDGIQGANDRRLLQEAAARSRLRYESTLIHGTPIEIATACTACGRHRGEQWCSECGLWHHTQCMTRSCRLPPVDDTVVGNARAASVQYAWKEGDQTLVVQAGDGSVAEANTTNVQGGWALQAPGGNSVTGQLRIHRPDITSTRCEIHALLGGLNQQQRDVARQTVQDGEIGMIYNGKWSESLRRFYWRARSNVLHTNAVKNRFDSRWSARCATCSEVDTQDHRFGLIEPECEHELIAKLTTLHRSLISQQWVPDQEIFLPAIAHDIGTSCGLEQRGPWCGNEPSNFLWLTMIRADNGMWLNPQWLDWLGDPAALSKDLRFLQLLENEAEPNRPRGSPRCMIPVGLIEAMVSTFLALKNGGKVFSAAMKVRVGNPHWCIGS